MTDRVQPKVGEVLYRTLTDQAGNAVRVRIELDLGLRLEHEIARLANKARASSGGRCASAAGGVIRVCLLPEEKST